MGLIMGVQDMIQEATERVRQMEQRFDMLQNVMNTKPDALLEDVSIREMLQSLTEYYENGQWLCDYELDETGLLPQDLKRGVLAQDAVYDFLERIKNFTTNQ